MAPASKKQVCQVRVWKTAAAVEAWFQLLLGFTYTISRLCLAVACLQLYLRPLSGTCLLFPKGALQSPVSHRAKSCCRHPCDP